MIIGTFKTAGSSFTGTIETLNFRADVVFEPITGKGEKSPDYRVTGGLTELGAAWNETSRAGKPYLSVRLDDPTLAAPIHCRLVAGRDSHLLMWSRDAQHPRGGEA